MPTLQHRSFRLISRPRWTFRFGPRAALRDFDEVRARAARFANTEVGADHVVSVNEILPPYFTVTVWYRAEEPARAKPAKAPADDEYFATSGGR